MMGDAGNSPHHVAAPRKLGTGYNDAAAGIHGAKGGLWKLVYTDDNGVMQEIALGAAGTYYRSAGAAAAPTMASPAPSELVGGNWKVLFTNGSGVVTELALGANDTVLKGEGTSSAPTFGIVQATEIDAGTWKVVYWDGSGNGTEVALGASGTALVSNGASSAPTFQPVGGTMARPNITPYSEESMGSILAASALAAPASFAWPTANYAIYIPFVLGQAITAKGMFTINGGTVSGNMDLAIYSSAFAKLVSTGATAQAGTNAGQLVDIADTALAAGLYYLALAMDNATGTFVGVNTAVGAQAARSAGANVQTSAYTLPATATPIAINTGGANCPIPMFGLTTTTHG